MSSSNAMSPTDLKARVKALGHKLVVCPLHELDAPDEESYTGLHILDPKTDKLVIVSAGGPVEDDFEVEGWCKKIEKKRGEQTTTETPRQPNVDVEEAIRCIATAERFSEVCAAAVESLNTEYSGEIAFTMNSELWVALQDARVALGDKIRDKQGIYHDVHAAQGGAA